MLCTGPQGCVIDSVSCTQTHHGYRHIASGRAHVKNSWDFPHQGTLLTLPYENKSHWGSPCQLWINLRVGTGEAQTGTPLHYFEKKNTVFWLLTHFPLEMILAQWYICVSNCKIYTSSLQSEYSHVFGNFNLKIFYSVHICVYMNLFLNIYIYIFILGRSWLRSHDWLLLSLYWK